MDISNKIILSSSLVGGGVQQIKDLENVNKDLQPAYLRQQSLNALKTSAKDVVILGAGAAGTAAATTIAANKSNIINKLRGFSFKDFGSKIKDKVTADNFKKAAESIKENITLDKLKSTAADLKQKITADNLNKVSASIKEKISLGKLKEFPAKLKNVSVDKFKTTVSNKLSPLKDKVKNFDASKLVNKVKNLPGPAKAVAAVGAAITALLLVKNKTNGAYNSGKISQKYQDMSKELDKYEKVNK